MIILSAVLAGISSSLAWSQISIGSLASSQSTTSSCSGGPPNYCASSKQNIVGETPKAPPPVNTPFRDPDFGSRMVRVTGPNTMARFGSFFNGINFMTDASSETSTWSVFDPSIGAHGGYRFFITNTEGWEMPFILDATTMQVSQPLGLQGGYLHDYGQLNFASSFSSKNPDILFGVQGTELVSYNFATDAVTSIYNFARCPNLPSYVRGYAGSLSSSGDDMKFAYYLGGREQGDTALVVYYNRTANGGAGACYWYDTQLGKVGGTNMATKPIIPPTGSYQVHNARMSKDGTVVKINTQASNSIYFWKAGTAQVLPCWLFDGNCGGHQVLGYTHMINDPNNSDMADVLIRPLSLPSITTLLVNPLPWPRQWNDSHWSWGDANPADTTPVCGSFYASHGRGNGTQNVQTNPLLKITAPYDREIVCVSTSGPSKVWRFAHTRATGAANDNAWEGSSFWAMPRGNVSPDGRFYMFTSDWEWSLGNPKGSWGCPAEGKCRTDVFIVELH